MIEYRELTGMDELYDLEADPFEEHNLFGRAEAAPTLARMRSELQRLQAGTVSRSAPPKAVPAGAALVVC